jgi:transketolase
VINALAGVLPELWGGSADLGESNGTTIAGGGSFLPAGSPAPEADPFGRVLHFGIREHAMGAILNGIALHGLTRAFGGTFLVFSDYMRPSVRLAALMALPTTYVWTHDSIGVGEDGPTHQPVEHLWALRAIPGLAVARPADANEAAEVWAGALETPGPTGLILTRQDVPVLDRSAGQPDCDARRGGYVIAEASADPQLLLLATGSEVAVALAARTLLEDEGVPTRVVSMPCLEWFADQPDQYREQVLPPSVLARVSVEAGSAQGWWRYVGQQGACVSIDHFGASAAGSELFEQLGFTAENVAKVARSVLARVG